LSLLNAAHAQLPFATDALLPQHHAAETAGPVMTLEQLEQAALERNPEIRVAVRQVSMAQARVGAAGALDDPMFMYRGWGVPLRQVWDLNQAQNMFMVTQSFPWPGKRGLRSTTAEQEVAVAKAMLDVKRLEVLAKVHRAYADLLLNQEELRIHDKQAAIARQGLEAARIKYTAGNVPQQDVLKAQVALSRLADHLIMLRQTAQLALASLNTLVGRDPAAPLQVTGTYQAPSALPTVSALQVLALANRPELRAADAGIEQGESALKLARKGYAPDYTASLGYMIMPGASDFRNAYMAEFSLNLPWLNHRRHDSEIEQAKAKLDTSHAEFELERSLVLQQVQEALVRAQATRELAELYGKVLRPQVQATLRSTIIAYENDRTDFLNLLDSQNAMLEVETSYVRAAGDFEARFADLELAVGAPIPRDSQPVAKEVAR
jgi:outer membrane protein TolC